ncbi:MAG: type II toxin-antitoxin system HicA family toxin [bacterium]
MTKLPSVSGKDVIRILESIGYYIKGQKGSHVKLKLTLINREHSIVIPTHRELYRGTLLRMIKKYRHLLKERSL